MKREKTYIVLAVGLLLLAAPAFAQIDSLKAAVSPRLAAIGGLHAADRGGFESLFENPAGLAEAESQWIYSRVAVDAAGPMFDIANMVLSGSDVLTNITSLLDDNGRLYTGFDLAAPIAFGYVGEGLGVGVFNRTYILANAPSLTSSKMTLREEFLLTGGYARQFELGGGHRLDAGVVLKGFLRNELVWSGPLTDITTAFSDLFGSVPFSMVTGFGVDAGVLWTFSDFGVGLVGRDLFTPYISTTYSSYNDFTADAAASKTSTETGALPIDLSLGARWNPRWGFLARSGSELTLLFDYKNILGLFRVLDRNPILEVGIGAEVVLLEILSLRAGIQDALPSFGFGLDLQYFDLSLSMCGEELGLEPGDRPVFHLAFAMDFVY